MGGWACLLFLFTFSIVSTWPRVPDAGIERSFPFVVLDGREDSFPTDPVLFLFFLSTASVANKELAIEMVQCFCYFFTLSTQSVLVAVLRAKRQPCWMCFSVKIWRTVGPDVCWGPAEALRDYAAFLIFLPATATRVSHFRAAFIFKCALKWQTLKGLCFAFLMPLTGHQSTGTSLKPCFNLDARANRPPVGLPGCTVCVTLSDSWNCVFTFTFGQQDLQSPRPPWCCQDSCGGSD